MADRLKLTMPILVRSNFCIKLTHYYFIFKIQNDQYNYDWPIFGRLAAKRLTKEALHMNFDLLLENVIKSRNWSNLGRLAVTPICPKRPTGVPQINESAIFFIKWIPFYSVFV